MIVESLLVKKKNMDEKPIRQSSLVVLQVLCVKLKCLVQRNVYLQLYRPEHWSRLYEKIVSKLESAIIHHQVLLGRGSKKR